MARCWCLNMSSTPLSKFNKPSLRIYIYLIYHIGVGWYAVIEKVITCYRSWNWAIGFFLSAGQYWTSHEYWCSWSVPAACYWMAFLPSVFPLGSQAPSWGTTFLGSPCASWPRISTCRWGWPCVTFPVGWFIILARGISSWSACSNDLGRQSVRPASSIIRFIYGVWLVRLRVSCWIRYSRRLSRRLTSCCC